MTYALHVVYACLSQVDLFEFSDECSGVLLHLTLCLEVCVTVLLVYQVHRYFGTVNILVLIADCML